ncbi:MAG: exodeoxyribonuclease V subunit beta [Candidatus Muiribacteriota bacterium]
MENFDLIKTKLGKVNLIEASAGTGKTYNIAGIYLRLIVEQFYKPSEILVVTFTDAATGELKDRIMKKLKKALGLFNKILQNNNSVETDDSENEQLLKIYEKLQNKKKSIKYLNLAVLSFDEAAIFTIHGFCKKILNENAFESKTMFNFKVKKDVSDILYDLVLDYFRKNFMTESLEFIQFLQNSDLFKQDSIMQLTSQVINNPKSIVVPDYDDISWNYVEKGSTQIASEFKSLKNLYFKNKEDIIKILNFDGLSKSKIKSKKITEYIDGFDELIKNCDIFNALEVSKYKYFSLSYLRGALKKNFKEEQIYHKFFEVFEDFLQKVSEFKELIQKFFILQKKRIIDFVRQKIDIERKKISFFTFSDLLKDTWKAVNSDDRRLINVVRKKFKAALIDEFQDTDTVQYEIFKKLFFENKDKISFMIGDPKQSIYRFRGADIYSYLKAKKLADNKFTLNCNYRSCSKLLTAFNTLFSHKDNLFKNTNINYEKVSSGCDNYEYNRRGKPLEIVHVKTQQKKPNKEDFLKIIFNHVSYSILNILNNSEIIKPDNITVLVKTNQECERVKNSLAELGIPSVVSSTSDIFRTEEAKELFYLLKVILEPSNISYLGLALSTCYLNKTPAQIKHILDDDNENIISDFQQKFKEINDNFFKKGFASAVELMNNKFEIYSNLLQFEDSERKITNYRHLIELIQEGTLSNNNSLESIIKWIHEQIFDDIKKSDSSQKELRLESDEKAVKILTLHKSKGLQFDVVFCPSFIARTKKNSPDFSRYHDSNIDDEIVINISGDEFDKQQKEEEEEEMRLFYVGLTRAVKKCVLYLPDYKISDKSPMGYILGDSKNILNELKKIAEKSENTIGITSIDETFSIDGQKKYEKKYNFKLNMPQIDSYKINNLFKIHSYSSLTKSSSENILFDFYGEDEVNRESFIEFDSVINQDVFNIPKGANTGNFFHQILEEIPFNIEDNVLKEEVSEKSFEYQIDSKWHNPSIDVIKNVLNTNLFSDNSSFKLKNIPLKDRLSEPQFYMACDKLNSDILIKKIKNIFSRNLLKDVNLNFKEFEGFLTGFADLIFRYKDKYYIVDWKSNYLGNSVKFYSPQRLKEDIIKNKYFVQIYIYSQALHYYLEKKLPNYNYNSNFGGVFYIYLRGVTNNPDDIYGKYFKKIDKKFFQ